MLLLQVYPFLQSIHVLFELLYGIYGVVCFQIFLLTAAFPYHWAREFSHHYHQQVFYHGNVKREALNWFAVSTPRRICALIFRRQDRSILHLGDWCKTKKIVKRKKVWSSLACEPCSAQSPRAQGGPQQSCLSRLSYPLCIGDG